MVVLPSLGRAIGGDGGGALGFIAGRAFALLPSALVGGLVGGYGGLILVPVATLGIISGFDIATTPAALQPRRFEIVPAPVGDRHAPGVAILGSF
jgi:hypothetical protein